MTKFLKNITLFSLPVLMLLFTFEILLRKIPNHYSYKKNYLDKHSKEIEVLFFGSSHTFFGIDPTYLKRKGFIAAHISQSLNYDAAILFKYCNNCDGLKYIFVPINYLSLYYSIENGIEKWRVKNYNIYYGINKSYAPKNNFEILNEPILSNIDRFKNTYLKGNNITCNELGCGRSYAVNQHCDFITSGKDAAIRHSMKNDSNVAMNISYRKQIIEFANSKDIKVVLYSSPAFKTYVNNLAKNQLSNTITVIDSLIKSSTNVSYYNLLNDSTFSEKDFYDADHLNTIGAKKLSLKFDSLTKK